MGLQDTFEHGVQGSELRVQGGASGAGSGGTFFSLGPIFRTLLFSV